MSLFSGLAFAGKDITGRGDTVDQACWNYNFKANQHAKSHNSCWGICVPEKVTTVNGKFEYTFNNPNQKGSCPEKKYDGGEGKTDKDFYAAYPPPAGIANPHAVPASPSTGTASYIFRNHFPAANQGKLSISNTTSSEVRYNCEISRKSKGVWGVYATELFIVQPNSSVDKGYHSFDTVEWDAKCKKI
jgi:hypothetical protein